jgi:hypothetical protein
MHIFLSSTHQHSLRSLTIGERQIYYVELYETKKETFWS